MQVCWIAFCRVRLFITLWTVTHQAPLSMGFSRQECWSGLPYLPPGDLPNPVMEPASLKSPALADRFFITSATCKYSVQFSLSVMSHSLPSHGLQHIRSPCPSPTPRACSNSCPSSRWCLPTISSSVIPFSSCFQSFSASGSFPMSKFFTSGGQSIGVSASTSVLPMTIQNWFPLGWTYWIGVAVQGTLKSLLQHHSSKASILRRSAFFMVQLSHPYMTTGKTIALTRQTFVNKEMSLVFSMLSSLVIAFLSSSSVF